MSKAFTKEDPGPEGERLPDLPQSPHPNYVTPEGLADLNARLLARREALAELKAAGDSMDGRMAAAMAERDIRFLEERANRAILVDPSKHPEGVVAFGAEVEVVDDDDQTHCYRIVGEDQADPKQGLIAPFSPLSVALLGAGIGDVVNWRKPTGVVNLEITAIRFPASE